MTFDVFIRSLATFLTGITSSFAFASPSPVRAFSDYEDDDEYSNKDEDDEDDDWSSYGDYEE